MDAIKCELTKIYENINEYTKLKNYNQNKAEYFRQTIDICIGMKSDTELIELIKYSAEDDQSLLNGNQFLNFVAKSGDTSTMFMLVKLLPNSLEELKPYFNSALLDAVQYQQNLDMVKILIYHSNADINCSDKSGNSPLHWAVFGACSDIIRYLIYKEAIVDRTNLDNETPLHWCAVRFDENKKYKGVDSEIKYWYDQITDFNIKKKVYLAIALNFINDTFADIRIKNTKNQTAVGIIEERLKSNVNYDESQKEFILNKMFPFRGLNNNDEEIFINACKVPNLLQIDYMLDNMIEKFALTKTDSKNQTGFHCLISSFNYHQNHNAIKKQKFNQVVEKLIELVDHEFLTNILETEYGENVFLCAVKYGNANIVQSILKKCGKSVLSHKTIPGYYGIHLAAANNQVDTIKVLFESGDDLNKSNDSVNRDSAIFMAVHMSNCDSIECLVNLGADVNKTDKFGFPPIFASIDDWDREVTKNKLPKSLSRIDHWYKQLIEIGFRNCVNIAIACYLINDCKSRLDTGYLDRVSEENLIKVTQYVETDSKAFGNVIDLLKYRIKSERDRLNLNETQIDFLHRYIISYDNSSSTVYRNLSDPRGYCIIINNYEVRGKESRVGSEVDAKNLENVFTEHKYTVKSHNNLKAEQMRSLFEETYSKSENQNAYDSLIVIIMSHGGEETILGSDGISVKIRDIIELFDNEKCPKMKQKPKIFIFQACRGENEMFGVEGITFDGVVGNEYKLNVRNIAIPNMTDVIICYATVYGYNAVRTETGSWYCQAMCDVLEKKLPNCDLLTQLQIIDKKVQLKHFGEIEMLGEVKQVTSYENIGFNKKFFFNL